MYVHSYIKLEREREQERETETERQRERQTDRPTEREAWASRKRLFDLSRNWGGWGSLP